MIKQISVGGWAMLIVMVTACAVAKDTPVYEVGIFMATEQVSDSSVSAADCGAFGCSTSTKNRSHNVHRLSTPEGIYTIEAPVSVSGSAMRNLMVGGNDLDVHKAWFMDNLREGDKVLFSVEWNKRDKNHAHPLFRLPDPDHPGKEITTGGSFAPAVAKTNTGALCGTGKLTADVEAQVCGKPADAQSQAAVAPVAPVVRPAVAQIPAPAVQSIAGKPAVVQPAIQQAPACKSVMTDANGQQTCLDR
ncbi:MAG: hypothetical protein WBM24_01150 [Candidatus Sulfotelmatobacter sp.]